MTRRTRGVWGLCRTAGLVLTLLAGSAAAEERQDAFIVQSGEEGPDSCRVMPSESMLSYVCGQRDGEMTAGVVLFPDLDSVVILGHPRPWHQQRATELASRLATALDNVRQTIKADPRELSAEARTSREQVIQGLDGFEAAAEQLAEELRAGKRRDETRPTLRRIH